jgi:hypothetical protein
MFSVVLGAFLISVAVFSSSDVFRSHGRGLGKYGPPIEPRWLPKLLLAMVGIDQVNGSRIAPEGTVTSRRIAAKMVVMSICGSWLGVL